jgi:hypothetical protein
MSAAAGSSAGKRSRDQGGCHSGRSDRLGVRPAQLVRRSDEQDDRLHGTLRVLYRDYLAGGGLDCLRASRCHPRPPKPGKPRRPR